MSLVKAKTTSDLESPLDSQLVERKGKSLLDEGKSRNRGKMLTNNKLPMNYANVKLSQEEPQLPMMLESSCPTSTATISIEG